MIPVEVLWLHEVQVLDRKWSKLFATFEYEGNPWARGVVIVSPWTRQLGEDVRRNVPRENPGFVSARSFDASHTLPPLLCCLSRPIARRPSY